MSQSSSSSSLSFRDLEGLSHDLSAGLLFDGVTSDMALKVQDDHIHAHRAILAARSPVFRAMFFGAMKERLAQQLEVSMFTPATMRLLLTFIYTGSVKDVKLEETVPLVACADHYGVTALKDSISEYLRDSISPETACQVLATARTYSQDHIVEGHLAFILTHAQEVLKTEGFLHLDVNMLMKILESDDTRIEEIDLFKALVRWYRHWAKDPEVRPDEKQAERLFASVRYGQMTGQQLVAEVRPLAGEIVPHGLYVQALEHVAAPAYTKPESGNEKQSVRRRPALGKIQASDPSYLHVRSTSVTKVGAVGWNCTAVIDPSTTRTLFTVEHLADPHNGMGIGVFNAERNVEWRGGGFPNSSQWGADCLVGIYGTGCFFGTSCGADSVLRWQKGITVEVTLKPVGGTIRAVFTTKKGDGDSLTTEGTTALPAGVKLAVALYSPDDVVLVESVW